jgi:hypothetical protein
MIFANISLSITGKTTSIFDLAIIQRVKESNCLNGPMEASLFLAYIAEFWGQ